MLYIGYLIILDVQIIKKSVSEVSLQRLENCMNRLYPSPLGTPPCEKKPPNRVKKHIKRAENMFYVEYLIILDGQNVPKNQFWKLYCLWQVHLAEDLSEPMKSLRRLGTWEALIPGAILPKTYHTWVGWSFCVVMISKK